MSARTGGQTLYRFFDDSGVLLYVGRTVAPERRWREHEKGKSWFNDVATVTRKVFPTAEAVDLAEREAIASEGPLYNVMLNGARRVVARPRRSPLAPKDVPETLVTRLVALYPDAPVVEIPQDCLGEGTECECANCHETRLNAFEDLDAKYSWHPTLVAEIAEVRRRYYAGDDLTDWYYDLYDVETFASMRLVDESKKTPLPAYVDLGEYHVAVECPFCFDSHRHFMSPGMAVASALVAPCLGNGVYLPCDEWDDYQFRLYAFGAQSALKDRAVSA